VQDAHCELSQGKTYFCQGDDCTAVLYLRQGTVKLTVVSPVGTSRRREQTKAHIRLPRPHTKPFVKSDCHEEGRARRNLDQGYSVASRIFFRHE
jgi:hypothetical protein